MRPAGTGADRNAIIAHLVWAVFFFTFVSNAMMAGARSLLSGRNLIMNASFPRAVLPLVAIVKAVFDFLPTMLVYFAFHAVLGQPFGLSLVMLPVDHRDPDGDEPRSRAALRAAHGLLPRHQRVPAVHHAGSGSTSRRCCTSSVEIPPKLLVYLRWNPLYPVVRGARADLPRPVAVAGYLLGVVGVGLGFFFVGAIVFLARERDFAVRL